MSDGTGHIGGEFAWVAPRVLPFFTAAANEYGVVFADGQLSEWLIGPLGSTPARMRFV